MKKKGRGQVYTMIDEEQRTRPGFYTMIDEEQTMRPVVNELKMACPGFALCMIKKKGRFLILHCAR